jgi:hypothetical protein
VLRLVTATKTLAISGFLLGAWNWAVTTFDMGTARFAVSVLHYNESIEEK